VGPLCRIGRGQLEPERRCLMNASGVNHQPRQERYSCEEAPGLVRSRSTLLSSAIAVHMCRRVRVSAAVVCEWSVLRGGVDFVEDYLGDFLANRIAGT